MNKFTREFLESLTFTLFNKNDWMEFSGCETNFPLIARTDEYTIIVDGANIDIYLNSSCDYIGFYAETNKGRELSWNSF